MDKCLLYGAPVLYCLTAVLCIRGGYNRGKSLEYEMSELLALCLYHTVQNKAAIWTSSSHLPMGDGYSQVIGYDWIRKLENLTSYSSLAKKRMDSTHVKRYPAFVGSGSFMLISRSMCGVVISNCGRKDKKFPVSFYFRLSNIFSLCPLNKIQAYIYCYISRFYKIRCYRISGVFCLTLRNIIWL